MSVAEYLTPHKNHLTHDTVTPTEQPSDLYLTGPRDLLVTKPSDRVTPLDSDPDADSALTVVTHTAELKKSSSPVILSSSYPLPPASSPTLPYPSALALSTNPFISTPSLSALSSLSIPPPISSSKTSFIASATSATSTSTSSSPTLTVDVPTTSIQRKPLSRGVSLPDSSDFYDDEIEEVSYGGVRPDVWCDDEPAPMASRDLCTMEIISLLL